MRCIRGAGSNWSEDAGEGSRSFIEHGGSFTYVSSLNSHIVNIMPIFGRPSWWGGDKNSCLGFSELV